LSHNKQLETKKEKKKGGREKGEMEGKRKVKVIYLEMVLGGIQEHGSDPSDRHGIVKVRLLFEFWPPLASR